MTNPHHDAPYEGRPHRLYFAITHHCNRSCPWCSVYSSPKKLSQMNLEFYKKALCRPGAFEVQLEGGEPTTHPQFMDFIHIARANPSCEKLILCTNGTTIPRKRENMYPWLQSLASPLTIKLSINHHLLDHDPGLIPLAKALLEATKQIAGLDVFFNVRLRKGYQNDDSHVRELVHNEGLMEKSNIFFLQRYGLATDETAWEAPFLAGTNFTLYNPDGSAWGTDLIARSEAMRILP